MSEEPFSMIATAVSAIASIGSAVSGIVQATSKPAAPKQAPAVVNAPAQSGMKMQQAAAFGRGQTTLTSQKLGSVGID